jgi:cytoskeletal protein RodZ
VSIGATLAEARHQAGLTVADVSARTFIREGLIRSIEEDEFAPCGGDVYARGHIRAIASVVGADPAVLISEYDAAHVDSGPPTLDDIFKEQPRRPAPPPRRKGGRLVPVVMLCCLVGVVFIAFQLTGTKGAKRPDAATSTRPAAQTHQAPPHRSRPGPSHPTAPSPHTPAPAPAVSVTNLTPVSAAAFGPEGTSDGDNPQGASLSLSGNPATPWHTDWYTTARFGNLQAGTGLLLDLGRTVTATGVAIQLGGAPGANLRVSAGTATGNLHAVAGMTDAGGSVSLLLASHPRVRYVLIWFTLLPPDAAGTYQAAISDVTVSAISQ